MPPRPEYSRANAPSWCIKTPASYTRPAPPRAIEPAVRGGPVWERMLEAARAARHPEPERMAESMFQTREKALAIKAARHHIERTDAPPKPAETVVAPKVKARKVVEALKCRARTLAGKQCAFKATCGEFCGKHAIQK